MNPRNGGSQAGAGGRGRAGEQFAGHGGAESDQRGGSAAKRSQHLSALRRFFDRLVQRHVVLLNPAASVRGINETVVEGKTPEITIDQARKVIASVGTTYTVKAKGQQAQEVVSVVGLRDRAILATLAYTACRAGAVARLRMMDFQHDGEQYVLRFPEKGGKSREIPGAAGFAAV